ncbi:hypothetical protein GUITHDRAFT_133492 [Guillardia theta CCMP2712]|uniref:PPPDE domain-containing protein n=1 Tax=Guillardia theta (strain CCMP2712) TaxID=905079 RepID=L1JX15_GUITC|nr:hypothetical protein GUITHDRAFT_133492 [Guillardia theta CCMP2712]EKX53126.1 hypothetical protein GUITHDRAFT_133492 [Guillardia theta CCMP2712]|eukprot:XP_005840106.1 hypothetical protein GUITHDRAFT_133492 [Guillardia theta CCMP2712]
MASQRHVEELRSASVMCMAASSSPPPLVGLRWQLRGGAVGDARGFHDPEEEGEASGSVECAEDEDRKRELYDLLGFDADADPSAYHTLDEQLETRYKKIRVCAVRGNISNGVSSDKELICHAIQTKADEIMVEAIEEAELQQHPEAPRVYVNYYDLRGVARFLASDEDASDPMEFGMWQLSIFLHGTEWTYCAYNGVISYDARCCPFGTRLHTVPYGRTNRSEEAIRTFLEEQKKTFDASKFNAWNLTSIDFAETLLSFLTDQELHKDITLTLPSYRDFGNGTGERTQVEIQARVQHFPSWWGEEALRLASMFKLWGKRPPNQMLLGPKREPIGPYLPTRDCWSSAEDLTQYWEPPEGFLYVGEPEEEKEERAMEENIQARRNRMRGIARAMDELSLSKMLFQPHD